MGTTHWHIQPNSIVYNFKNEHIVKIFLQFKCQTLKDINGCISINTKIINNNIIDLFTLNNNINDLLI